MRLHMPIIDLFVGILLGVTLIGAEYYQIRTYSNY